MEKEFIIVDPYENELYTYLWETKAKFPKGVVQIIHGASEHVTRYREFAEYLNSIGFIVIGNDHLGHGKTADTNEYVFFSDTIGFHKVYEGVKIVRDYIEEHYPDLPVIMFAHSMGSFIGRYAILYDYKRYNQAVFSGTGWFSRIRITVAIALSSIIIKFKSNKHVSKFFTVLISENHIRSMKRNGIINKKIEWLTSDREIQNEFSKSEMCGKPFTIGAQRDLYRFLLEIQNKKLIRESASSTAIYFISGELDALGSYGIAAKKLYNIYNDCGYSNVKYTVLNNARHEIINEIDRKNIFITIGNWMIKNVQ